MGKKNRQRRAAKAKQRFADTRRRNDEDSGRRTAAPDAGDPGPRDRYSTEPPLEERVRTMLDAAVHARLDGEPSTAGVMGRVATERARAVVLRETATQLRRALPRLWSGGWQPAEIVRHARRMSPRAGRVITVAVLADHADRARSTLHTLWAAQVDELAASDPAARAAARRPNWLEAFVEHEGLADHVLGVAVVDALAACLGVGRLPLIVPSPGADQSAVRARRRRTPDDPVLAKVRALLAQAESTTFEAEAAAFTAKAQELMARHALDHALVWEQAGRDDEPETIRLPIDDPYADAKSLLLHVVADSSRCRCVIHERYGLCSVVGFAADVASTEVLFTSLLVQSQVAMHAEAASAGPGSHYRSRSFRSAFLTAYAHRIAERLDEVNEFVEADVDTASSGSLLPVLAARASAVDDAVDALFGKLRSSRLRGATDPLGWARGRSAADRANLTSGDLAAEYGAA